MRRPYTRLLLFVFGCMGSRTALVWTAHHFRSSARVLAAMASMAVATALAMLYIYATGSRKTGAEVFGDRI
jgi:hypothetical protein